MSQRRDKESGLVPRQPGRKRISKLNRQRYSDQRAWRRERTFVVANRDCHGLLYPAGYSRVRVRVGFLHPGPYPYPQPGVGGSAHTFKLRAKSTQTTPDASFGPYVGMFSSFFFVFFSELTHSL